MFQIKAHCPSDKSLFSLSYSSLWVTSPGSPSSFWMSFFLNHFRSWNDEENHNNTIFSWLLCHVNTLWTLPFRGFPAFSFYDVLWGTVRSPRGGDAVGFAWIPKCHLRYDCSSSKRRNREDSWWTKAHLFIKCIEKSKGAHHSSEYTCSEKDLDRGCLPLRGDPHRLELQGGETDVNLNLSFTT